MNPNEIDCEIVTEDLERPAVPAETGTLNRTPSELALPMAISAAAILACFAGLAFVNYGLYDDYLNGVRPLSELVEGSISDGRPVGGALLALGFGLTEPIAGLGVIRLLAVALVAAQASLTTMVLSRRLDSMLAATLISIAGHVTVGVQVITAWGATLWVAPLASLLAAAAGYVIWEHGRNRKLAAIASLALVASLAIYQPGGMASVGALGILAVTEPRAWRTVQHRLLRSAGWLGASFSVYFVVWRVGESLVPKTGARGGITTDVLGKANWVLDTVAPRIANPFSITEFHWSTGWVLVALIALSPISLDRSLRTTALRSAIALATPLVCYAPNLVVAESWASSRSLWVVLVTATILAGIGVYRLADQAVQRARIARLVLPLAATGFVAVLAVQAGDQTVDLLASPNAAELVAVQAAVGKEIEQSPSAIVIVPAGWQDSIARTVSFDEFGYPASAAAWAILPMVRPIVTDRGYAGPVSVVDSIESSEIPPGATIIDLGEVLDLVRAP